MYPSKFTNNDLAKELKMSKPNKIKNSNKLTSKNKISLGIVKAFVILLLFAISGFAQDPPPNPDRGFQPGSSHSISDIETVNTTNGNLMLNIPLVSLPKGRGEVGKSISLMYNSKLYDTTVEDTLDSSGQMASQNMLRVSDNGGWKYTRDGVLSYSLDVISRFENSSWYDCNGSDAGKNAYSMKVYINMPDGSRKEFRPTGFTDIYNDGYFAVMPSGYNTSNCNSGATLYSSSGMTYYSIDGSYTKLVVDYAGNTGRGETNPWTMYLPDGSKIRKDGNGIRTTDRNGNYIQGLTDNFGRSISIQKNAAPNEDHIIMQGVGNQQLKWKVKWKTVSFTKQYTTTGASGGIGRSGTSVQTLSMALKVVDRITLPTQLGNLYYEFNYNQENNNGWGELSSVTLPSGATTDYEYKWDTDFGSLTTTNMVLENSVSKKTLTYLEEYDGNSNSTSDVWNYNIGKSTSTVTSPDGTVTTNVYGDTSTESPYSGLVTKTSDNHGNVTESRWEFNRPPGTNANTSAAVNSYVKTSYTTIPDANGNPSLTKIVDNTIDPNGNSTETKEYDWVAYSSIPRDSQGKPNGIPSGAVLKRITSNVFYNSATSNSSKGYWNTSSPAKRDAVQYTTIKTPSGTPVAHTQFIYDNYSTKGNVTELRVWDSTKGAYTQALTSSNWNRTLTTYDTYGNPTLITDPKGYQTKITYGAVNGYAGLYPTKTETAYNTSVERTATSTYDFYTGLVTSTTDVDNNVSTATDYDALGRPTKVKAAVGTSNEIWTQTEYGDLERRVIKRSDLYALGDAKKVSISHYDQLGRPRLVRTLENSATEDEYDETDGIKVQTRYETSNPYTYSLTSNPYRAAYSNQAGSEQTMGWSRSKSWNHGRRSEAEHFSGASLPAPWGSNSNSTGVVVTETDANASTVTNQAGKQRRNISNALGQVTRVDEPNSSGSLGTVSSPTQATYYSYNTQGNMVEVTQGVQKRYFLYDSLGRLIRVRQPEQQVNTALNLSGQGTSNTQWTTASTYDANGNVLTTIDAKNVTTTYTYDQLNRTLTRTYSDGTPTATFTYDDSSVPFSKGQLTKTSNSVSTSQITAFDNMGRVLTSQQITDGQTYTSSYQYNLSGRLTQETYPTGRVITNTFDSDGDISQITGQMGSTNKTYADLITYFASKQIEKLRIGNGLWEAAKLNSKMQATEIGLGTSATNLNLWKINLDYGELNTNGTVDTTKNTGNIAKQTISFSGLANPFIQTYKFDSLDRLIEAKETNNGTQTWKQTFDYDRYGNRTSFTQIVGSTQLPINNQTLPTVDPNTNRFQTSQGYTYDFNGNLIGDAEGRQFVFNADNKQTQVKDSQNTVIGQYYYDGNGKRIKKITAQETITFVYSGGKLVAEYSTQTPQSQATTKYIATDTLGSIRAITDQNANIVSRRDFMPFGEDLYAGTPSRTTNDGYKVIGDSVRQKFTGYERDEETGLDFAEARYYKNNHGRFTAVDPLLASGKSANPQTFNRYVYVMNSPLKYTDPTGLQAATHIGDVYGHRNVGFHKAPFDIYKKPYRGPSIFVDADDGFTYSVTRNGYYALGKTEELNRRAASTMPKARLKTWGELMTETVTQSKGNVQPFAASVANDPLFNLLERATNPDSVSVSYNLPLIDTGVQLELTRDFDPIIGFRFGINPTDWMSAMDNGNISSMFRPRNLLGGFSANASWIIDSNADRNIREDFYTGTSQSTQVCYYLCAGIENNIPENSRNSRAAFSLGFGTPSITSGVNNSRRVGDIIEDLGNLID